MDNQIDIFDKWSSSFHKVKALFNSTPKYAHIKNKAVTGYRIIDCSILSDAISVLSCPTCFQTTLAIIENNSKKRGLVCEFSIF